MRIYSMASTSLGLAAPLTDTDNDWWIFLQAEAVIWEREVSYYIGSNGTFVLEWKSFSYAIW
jgi:hypothetical protein